jgi:hypothetical protein
MLASDDTGTPAGKRAACSPCVVPDEMSITEPLMVMGLLNATAMSGAETVVWLGPRPTLHI